MPKARLVSRMALRAASRVVPTLRALEGGGFLVHRAFPTNAISDFDPFLMLDEMGPSDYGPGEAKGAPDHPHRGFETVTYMLSGSFEHEDSSGNRGRIGPGDVQWMTAGSGVIHSEMPSREVREKGGRLHGFQLWVNLPKEDKMMAPRYQEVPAASIPVARADGVEVRVIAGEALGVSARIDTRIPITYLHVLLQPGARIELPIPAEQRAFAFVVEGPVLAGPERKEGRAHEAVLFEGAGAVALEAGDAPVSALVLAGAPLGEPIARYGPFVMNTEAEIVQAIRDYQTGRFATIQR